MTKLLAVSRWAVLVEIEQKEGISGKDVVPHDQALSGDKYPVAADPTKCKKIF
jgi:hypothetical protein